MTTNFREVGEWLEEAKRDWEHGQFDEVLRDANAMLAYVEDDSGLWYAIDEFRDEIWRRAEAVHAMHCDMADAERGGRYEPASYYHDPRVQELISLAQTANF